MEKDGGTIMRRTGYLHDGRYLKHRTPDYHPETHLRLEAIHKGISESGLLKQLLGLEATEAGLRWIEEIHIPEYIFRVEEACILGLDEIDTPDCQICPETYDIALLAAGGLMDAADRVMRGEIDNAFCAIRPPGHHAEINKAMGFCYFNNVAIAARYLQRQWGLKRVAIIDFDVHHGNGTQHAFESDPTVFYASIHEHPSFAFPGTGREFERGKGEGMGTTLNIPMLPSQGDEEYRDRIETVMLPELYDFHPEFVILSTGFDAHEEDDMSGINLTTDGYSWIMERMMDLADECADGKVISVLEGGYCLHRLPELAKNHVEILTR